MPVPRVMKAHCSYFPILPSSVGYFVKSVSRTRRVDEAGTKKISLKRVIVEVIVCEGIGFRERAFCCFTVLRG